jgi:hypothetical protein
MAVLWTEAPREPRPTKRSTELIPGDHILDEKGTEYAVTETRRDPFAPGPRWILIRLRNVNDPIDEGEICCTATEQFTMVDTAVTR